MPVGIYQQNYGVMQSIEKLIMLAQHWMSRRSRFEGWTRWRRDLLGLLLLLLLLLLVFQCMRRHARQAKDWVRTGDTVVMRLLQLVIACFFFAILRWRKFLKARLINSSYFLVIATMRHHFIRIRAGKCTLETVKMWRLGTSSGIITRVGIGTIRYAAVYRTAKLPKVISHQWIKTLVAS